jgi:hypothetical protein
MNKVWVGTALLVLVVAASCQTTKKTTRTTPEPPKSETVRTSKKVAGRKKAAKDVPVPPVPNSPLPTPVDPANAALGERLDRLSGIPLAFQTFSGKAKAKLTRGDESNEFTANIRIRQGKAIWINISALGGMVNVARLYVTPDSVRMINFLQKTATLLPAAEAGKLLPVPVSFPELQALLLGYPPLSAPAPEQPVARIHRSGDTLLRQLGTPELLQTDFFTLPDSVFRGYELVRNALRQPFSLQMVLSDLSQEGNRRFYKERMARWSAAASTGELRMEFDSPQWDSELSMPFSVPKSYKLN